MRRQIFHLWIATFFTLVISGKLPGQRLVDYSAYSESYFDSIRATVNDTTEEHYTIQAYRLKASEQITIDGKLTESAWSNAEHEDNLLEKEPYPLVPLSEKTEFAILYDDENLYIGVWCWDSEPEKIIQQITPRGTSGPDNLMLFLDTYHDHRTGYKFTVSTTGVQLDELRYDDVKRDSNWNGVWSSAGSVDDRGWYAEVMIPFFNLRFRNQSEQIWGFNIMRSISKNASRGQWKPHLPEWDNTTRMSQLGHILGIRDIKTGRQFELRPYGLSGSTESVNTPATSELSLGGDLRYSPIPNITTDVTINPDFAQVDADVFQINLTRFPTRFPELRPFFTERTNIFNTPMELFYSRRIGARGDIIGGVKMTGKFARGFEFGTLGNLTGESIFSANQTAGSTFEKARFGVFRVKKDLMGSSSIGLLAATKEQEHTYNRVLGLDGSFILSTHNLLDLQVATGRTEAGYSRNMAYTLSLTRTGDLFGGQVLLERVEPFFEINQIGYLRKELSRGWNKGSGFVRFSPRINAYHIRRLTFNLELNRTVDLFTQQYIDRWREMNPELLPDQMFGTAQVTPSGLEFIADGTLETDNLTHNEILKVNFLNEMTLTLGYTGLTATELTGDYSGNQWQMSYATRPLRLGPRFAGVFGLQGGTFYNFDQKYVGRQRSFSVDGESRLRHNIVTALQGEYTHTYDPTGAQDGRYWKLSSNTTWMFTKDFYLRLHTQGIFGNTYYGSRRLSNQYLLSMLISWEYRPGSFLYLAYNEGRVDESNPFESRYFAFNDRTIVFKASYLLNI
ncbi:MAG TPA: DUF5916 domain-containing protein [bacterium]|nr:DUF5916 domain-containing protein [bacterium]